MAQIQSPKGYTHLQPSDPAEDYYGPFFYKIEGERVYTLVETQPHHRNGIGTVHGGLLLTFADYTLCMGGYLIGGDAHMNTVHLDATFINSAAVGGCLEGRVSLVRVTGRSVFARGRLMSGDEEIMMFSGYIKLMA